MTGATRITSRDNALLVRLRKLAHDPAGYRKHHEIWIEGDHLCRACVERGVVVEQAVVTEAGWAQPDLRALAGVAARVAIVDEAHFKTISTLESPAPVGFVLAWNAAASVMEGVPSIVLDRLQDAGNVGSILRSAAVFGFRQVIALKGTAALWSPKVVRAGMGAHFGLHLLEAAVLPANLGLPLLATSSHAVLSVHEARLPWPCAWVLGHEGQGVDEALMARCEARLRIPQPGGEESLNVAAAAAVCLYESARQRDFS